MDPNTKVDHSGNTYESNGGGNASIAWSCFDRARERTNQGLDEDAIRAATGSMYAGEEVHPLYKM